MTSYSHVGINVVARPPSRPVGAGRVRTVWRLETLADLPLVAGSTIDLTGVSRDMSVTATVTGPRTIAMECTCAEELADPYRLGSAGLAWRVIDENYARLWMIGDSPRAHHTPFMRQRREMAGRLTPPARNLWLWLSMTRAEPLFAAVAAQESRADRLLEQVGEPEAVALFGSLAAAVASAAPGRQVGILLTEAFRTAVDGGSTGSVDLVAAATERLFDALLLVDEAHGRGGSPAGFAAAEDLAWFADCGSLESLDTLGPVIDRSRRFTSRLTGAGLEALVR